MKKQVVRKQIVRKQGGTFDKLKWQRRRRHQLANERIFREVQEQIAAGVKFLEPWSRSNGTKPWRGIGYVESKNGCWLCTTHLVSSSGYPRIRRNGKLIQLSRYVYEKFNDPILKGLCVMHECDNKLCINPKHLRVGTLAQNTKDEWDRGLLPWRRNCGV